MRVVDGMHRLQAARLNGAKTIVARFFHGDDEAAFVEAVKSNIAHGLPLSLADRKAASLRIITAHPPWQLPTRTGFELDGCRSATMRTNSASASVTSPSVCVGVGSG